MKVIIRMLCLFTVACALLAMSPQAAEAYIGPGVGVTAIGTVIAFLGAILFAIVGFVWYPIKRLLRTIKGRGAAGAEQPGKA